MDDVNQSGAMAASAARDWLLPAIRDAKENLDQAIFSLARQMYERTGHGKWAEAAEAEKVVFTTYATIALSVILAGIASP